VSAYGLPVAIVGCGLIGAKRAGALRPEDRLVGCWDICASRAESFALEHHTLACSTLEQLFELEPEVVVVAVSHDSLAGLTQHALEAGAHVLVEKPAGMGCAQVQRLIAAERDSGRRVKVGFNHRFHPGLRRAAAEVHSGAHGELLHLRGRYGHGGRLGYEREWRAQPERSGGGELIDQGMHLLDLSHWIAGELPLHCALLRTQFWDMPVEDNAALILGDARSRSGAWAMLHVTWTEWKNLFGLEIYCREAKIQVDGLVGSYGAQRLRIYRMGPELGPPDLQEFPYPMQDSSWKAEWEHFALALESGGNGPLLGDLSDAHYAWTQIESAYSQSPYAEMRQALLP
jgi:predicted dehydrogenase